MENKPKKTGRFRRFFLRLLGPSLSQKLIYWLLRKKIDRTPAAFPSDLSRGSDLLFILPADRTEMIFQLETLFAILGKYKNSSAAFVCPAACSPFVSGLKNARVIKFDPNKFLLYSEEFNRVVKDVATKSYDICVMFERQYALPHLYLVGVSRAHLRVGWERGDSAPFLNIRLVSSPVPRENVTLWERNSEAAKILGADIDSKVRWGVQKSTAEEVAQLLSEYKLKKDSALICVDPAGLEDGGCAKEWCADLMKALKESKAGQFYIFGGIEGGKAIADASASASDNNAGSTGNADSKDNKDGADSGKDAKDSKDAPPPFPTLPAMSIPRIAALTAGTDLVITGPGALLGLAQISSSKIIPVLTKEQAAFYCKRNGKIMPVIIPEKPDKETIKTIVKNLKELMAPAPAPTSQPQPSAQTQSAQTQAQQKSDAAQQTQMPLTQESKKMDGGQQQNQNKR
jgi:hypothetical protein